MVTRVEQTSSSSIHDAETAGARRTSEEEVVNHVATPILNHSSRAYPAGQQIKWGLIVTGFTGITFFSLLKYANAQEDEVDSKRNILIAQIVILSIVCLLAKWRLDTNRVE